ncbi:unnamed protein product [Parnassius apollo]|uniref:(apollo) hypothetical protein n=1 Tax=Parnassius apollo TaxID=110799 RepID=A0A8S3XG45_PARAO|nr:unnamed protein product [Parnassius apollo]
MEARSQIPKPHNTNKVQISGYPPYTQPQDILKAFTPYGNVTIDKLTNKLATLNFANEDDAKAAIQDSKKINVYGEFLTVKPFQGNSQSEPSTPKRIFTMTKQKGVIIDPHCIDLSGDFHEQLDNIMAAVRLTQEEVTKLSTLYTDLEEILRQLWPGCMAMPFGSITTGLGIKTSDADCYVDIPHEFRHPNVSYVSKAKRILQGYPHLFAELIAIPRAHTPIVKFFHIPTQTNCDLTFKTPLGMQNSRLIAFLLHADPRFIPMAVVIKYWAKIHGFSGTGKLTNYALTMLIIFYLQLDPISILPSVQWLQKDPANECIIDFWNTGFIKQPDLLPKSSNTSSISELLGGFFEFYSTFNFNEMVVCPYIGQPIKKEAFKDPNLLPNEFERYKQNIAKHLTLPLRFTTSICVQDPIELCHNVASAITSKMAEEIKTYFKFAANAYEKEKLNGCKNFLKIILLHKPKIVRTKPILEYRTNISTRDLIGIVNDDWKSVVGEIVKVIFEQILLIKLTKVEEKVNPDTKKEKVKFTGTLTKAIWKRKPFSRLYRNLDFVEQQRKITEEIMIVGKQMIDLQFMLTTTYSNIPRRVILALKIMNGDLDNFREFGKFLNGYILDWFKWLLSPYLTPSAAKEPVNVAETIKVLDSNLYISNDSNSSSADEERNVNADESLNSNADESRNSYADESGSSNVNKSRNSYTDETRNSNAGESQNSNAEESQNSDVEESKISNTKESQNSNVSHSCSTVFTCQ